MKLTDTGMIIESKIVNLAHEIHVRLFPVYTFKTMYLNLEHDSQEPSETIEQLVQEITVRLLRLGKFLTDNSKVNILLLFLDLLFIKNLFIKNIFD